jgi:hypothetical protein
VTSYHVRLTVEATPHEVFDRVTSVSRWWNRSVDGASTKQDDVFTVRFEDLHVSTQKLIEVVPDRKVVWLVTDATLSFLADKHEWRNTTIRFELSTDGNRTHLDFTHVGLVPGIECYRACTKGWDHYIKTSLWNLLMTGTGMPD